MQADPQQTPTLQHIGWARYNKTDITQGASTLDYTKELNTLQQFYRALPADRYEPESLRYRRHSRGVYLPWEDKLSWLPNLHDDHYGDVIDYDMKGYNAEFLQVARQFPAIPQDILNNSLVQTVIQHDLQQTLWLQNFSKMPLNVGVGCVMLKVEKPEDEAISTPNTLHQDGGEVSFTFIHLICRDNVNGGINYIAPPRCVGLLPEELSTKLLLSEFTLQQPLDSFVVHNARVSHHVSSVRQANTSHTGERGILIVAVSPLVKQL